MDCKFKIQINFWDCSSVSFPDGTMTFFLQRYLHIYDFAAQLLFYFPAFLKEVLWYLIENLESRRI